MRTQRAWYVGAAAIVAAVAITGCNDSGNNDGKKTPGIDPGATPTRPPGTAANRGTTVGVIENHLAVVPDTDGAMAGLTTFVVHNDGVARHDFHVLKTDLPPDRLPVSTYSEAVVVSASGIEAIGQINNIETGASQSLTVDLTPGKYVLICNLQEHYEDGMRVGFVVR